MKRFFFILSLVALVATPAFAQEDRARAEAAQKKGVALYKDGKYEEAIASYQEAAKFAPTAAGPYREAGKAYELLGKDKEAIASYQEYLKRRPQASDAAEIQGRVSALEAKQPKVAQPASQEVKPAVQPQSTPATTAVVTPAVTSDEPKGKAASPVRLENSKRSISPARLISLGLGFAALAGTSAFLFGGLAFGGDNGDNGNANADAFQAIPR